MNRTERSRAGMGTLCVMLSALIFGVTPIMAKWTYAGGSNAVNLTLLRSLLALPVLLVLALRQPGGLRVGRYAALPLAAAGVLKGGTTILLYSSYDYVDVGMATTLHFVYPLAVAVLAWVVLRRRLDAKQAVGLALGLGGAALFALGADSVGLQGVALALISGVTYGGYMLLVECRLGRMPHFALSFYLEAVCVALSGGYGLATGNLTVSLTPAAWLYSFLLAIGITVCACVLLQVGIRYTGATRAALLSLLEPIASVASGVLFMGETLPAGKAAGCALILVSLLVSADWRR